MAFTYNLTPHPLATTVKSYKGSFLMTFAEAPGDHVLTDCEDMALALGGRHAGRWSGGGAIAYTLSAAQARDMAILIDNGWRGIHMPRHMRAAAYAERAFWHPEHGDWFERSDAIALCDKPPERCRWTVEMYFTNRA